jgi:hypothetical protein
MADPTSSGSKTPKLLDRVRATMRLNRYSPRTEEAYVDWIERFIRFHGVRHPHEMGADEVKAFLSHLATQMNVAASTRARGVVRWVGSLLQRQRDARARDPSRLQRCAGR